MHSKLETFAAKRGLNVDVARGFLANGPCAYLPDELRNDSTYELLLMRAEALKIDPMSGDIRVATHDGIRASVYLSADGYLRIANSHPEFDGLQIDVPPTSEWQETGTKVMGKMVKCPPWVSVAIHRKDRKVPTIVREYLDECYSAGTFDDATGLFTDGPWQRSPKRQLTNRAIGSAVRIAFGIVGIAESFDVAQIDVPRMEDSTKEMSEAPVCVQQAKAPTTAPVKPKPAHKQAKPKKQDSVEDVTEESVAKLLQESEELSQQQAQAEMADAAASVSKGSNEKTEEPATAPVEESKYDSATDEKPEEEPQNIYAEAIDKMWGFVRNGQMSLEQAKAWCLQANLPPLEESRVLGQITMELLAKGS